MQHFGIVFSAHMLKNKVLQHFGIVFNAHRLKNKMFEHLSSAGVVAGDRIGAWRHQIDLQIRKGASTSSPLDIRAAALANGMF